ncbi:MAG: BMP family ABC transporter substrate-binding protein [Caldisericia bacterium]|nr:BMP family ABC transporter substrate-binding protein [Caldisericia bacterium]
MIPAGCSLLSGKSLNQTLSVGFCIDILGPEEPVFTKPFLTAFNTLEKKKRIHLEIQTCDFASEYKTALRNLAQQNRIVFCGPLFSRFIMQVAKEFPETYFVLMQAIPEDVLTISATVPNLQWILYRKEDITFLMGQICSYFPKKASYWLVTDLPTKNPIRLYEETAFTKGLQSSAITPSTLEWPIQKDSFEQVDFAAPNRAVSIFCVTEGAYVPAFLKWISTLPGKNHYLLLPDVWNQDDPLSILGSVLKVYTSPLENIVQQVSSGSWQAGLHYMTIKNGGFLVRLPSSFWEPSLKKEIESTLNSSYDPEK